jgi:glycerol-3-phosphate acyltransferase PlsY
MILTGFMVFIFMVVAFLLGSIPTAYIVVKKLRDIDLRQTGSKNVGATNAARVLGNQWFVILTLLDAAKGVLACLLMMFFYTIFQYPELPFYYTGLPVVLAGVAAILGHVFTPWLGFKGGKGVATTVGVILLLSPITAIICMVFFALTLLLTKYVSLGSIIGACILPVGVFFERGFLSSIFFISLLIAIFIIVKHRSNISRLAKGEENKFGKS